jgi:hypothetical protein
MGIRFPGESPEYRTARDRLLQQEIELRRAMEDVAAARRRMPPGGPVPQDYVFHGRGADGAPAPVWPPVVGQQRPMMHFDFQVGDLDSAVAEAVALGASVATTRPTRPRRRPAARNSAAAAPGSAATRPGRCDAPPGPHPDPAAGRQHTPPHGYDRNGANPTRRGTSPDVQSLDETLSCSRGQIAEPQPTPSRLAGQDCKKASRSALIVSACVVGMPWG